MKLLIPWLMAALLLGGCYKSMESEEDDSDPSGTDTNTNTNTSADADADTDGDADTDSDTDSDTDIDNDVDTDTDTDTDGDGDGDADPGSVNGLDLGDAPLPYPTMIEDDGARHAILTGFYLGRDVDAESDGQPDNIALGDDRDGNDDENGIDMPPVINIPSNSELTVTCDSPDIVGYLQAWIDMNGDGDWADENEQFIEDLPLFPGSLTLTLIVSDDGELFLGDTFARFRFSSKKGLSPTGFAPDGEVEDYPVSLEP
ncbi:MAG: hypothetical protein GY854_15120 [Deltaproteobacteria bacterium]|nr:hypothetical protein [Deltaproteobacteria bacterium]